MTCHAETESRNDCICLITTSRGLAMGTPYTYITYMHVHTNTHTSSPHMPPCTHPSPPPPPNPTHTDMPGYEYTDQLLELDSCRPLVQADLPTAFKHIQTPAIAAVWEEALAGHPDRQFVSYVLQGWNQGFRIGF